MNIPMRFTEKVTNIKNYIPTDDKNIKRMAEGLLRFLHDNNLDKTVRIFYIQNNRWQAIQTEKPFEFAENKTEGTDKNIPWSEKEFDNHGNKNYSYYTIYNINANDYTSNTGEYLCMTFEDDFYKILNGKHLERPLKNLLQNYFSHWGLRYEIPYKWSLSTYKL